MARIMVVDDTAFMRAILKTALEEDGHKVVAEAANGQEAVQMYKQYKPALVTMDITMPVMDGLEALTEIRTLDPGAKIIMCSAMAQQKLVIEAIYAGAKDFIVKPFHKDRVLETIERVLEL